MIIENQRYFGKDIANACLYSSRDHGVIIERSKKPFSMVPRSFTMSIDDNENKLFRKASDRMVIEDPQQLDKSNPQLVLPYCNEIFQYLINEESKYLIDNYLTPDQQPDINSKMRAILIDWLADVHLKFKLKDETLYLTVSLIDRYLSKVQTSRMKLQLVGVSALFIACKYEEIYPPALKDFVYITDNAYVKQDVLDMESLILQALEFSITQPSSFVFLQKQASTLDLKNQYLAQYILELALFEYKFSFYRPSQLAAASVYLVNKIRKQNVVVSNEAELRPLAKQLCTLLQCAETNSLQAIRKKFSSIKYMEVARIRVEKQQKC